jgi:hypothetical protein
MLQQWGWYESKGGGDAVGCLPWIRRVDVEGKNLVGGGRAGVGYVLGLLSLSRVR